MPIGYTMFPVLLSILLASNAYASNNLQDEFIELFHSRIFENEINETLEDLKKTLRDGNPAIGLPSFDPYQLNYTDVNLKLENILTTNASASNIVVSGIPDFIATFLNLDIAELELNFTILFPEIDARTEYEGTGKLFQFVPIFGKGKASAKLANAEIEGYVKISFSKQISLLDLKLALTIGSAQFNLTGFMDDEEYSQGLVKTLDAYVGSIINDYKEEISEAVSPIIKDLINDYLKNKNFLFP
ncbi:PREDICTED: uncharacterized protein LOC108563663 [Nicrophorus vespilloides]|uniref:Uncharacterized protein LOC108563663 n=1 Tax=Nicrophorus vespilloides TaxID=110193 RepID=A0ABM1MTJ1_NICVS|nr:PREDICTED: uncharacterized protein LOC108563663 [Nicrophorus vespilloides]